MIRYPAALPDLSGNEEAYALEALRSGWISSSGEFVSRFEQEFARLCDARSSLAVCNGTCALHLVLAALDIGPGDEVLVPSLTFVATANAVRYVGARPVFVDVDPDTWCMDPQFLEAAMTSQTRAILPVHLFGHPADMDAIGRVASRHGLYVIEDAAEAHLARYKGRPVGGLGDAGCFSFFGNKLFTCGEGGAVVLNDPELDARMRSLNNHGAIAERRYYFPVQGYNFRLGNIACALLCAQLERATQILAQRHEIFLTYRRLLEGTPGIGFQPVASWAQPAPWAFCITIDPTRYGRTRDDLSRALEDRGVDSRPFFVPLHTLPPFRNGQPVGPAPLPITEELARSGLMLPTYNDLTARDVEQICSVIVEEAAPPSAPPAARPSPGRASKETDGERLARPEVLFVTERGERHRRAASAAAPASLSVKLLWRPTRKALLAHLAEADYLISERVGTIDAELIASAPRLRLIQRLGTLTHDIDLEAAERSGIEVCFWPIGSVTRVAEHLMLQMLALGRRLRTSEKLARSSSVAFDQIRTTADSFVYNWGRLEGLHGLAGKTVGILGFGEIGAELARRLSGWHCTVLYHKRRRLPAVAEGELSIEYASVPELCRRSDYLCNVLPWDETTDSLIDAAFLSRMKPGAFLASCGAGGVMDFSALAKAVESGRLAGVAVDSYDVEPPGADHPLVALSRCHDNVLLTPHVAAGDTRDPVDRRRGDFTNILSHLRGVPRRHVLVASRESPLEDSVTDPGACPPRRIDGAVQATLAVDLGGVLEETWSAKQKWLAGHDLDVPTPLRRKELKELLGETLHRQMLRDVYQPDAIIEHPSMAGARRALECLAGAWRIVIVTSRSPEKYDVVVTWLETRGLAPFVDELVMLGDEAMLPKEHQQPRSKLDWCTRHGVRFLVDDDTRHLAPFEAHPEIFRLYFQAMPGAPRLGASTAARPNVVPVTGWQQATEVLEGFRMGSGVVDTGAGW